MKIGNFEQIISDFKNGEFDKTIGGKCPSGCSECCGRVLPISQKEIDIIREYIAQNNVKPYKNFLYGNGVVNMCCPFLDMSKQSKHCMIYTVRPNVCKAYLCNNKVYDEEAEKQLFLSNIIVIDMWNEFFPESYEAKKIKEMMN